MLNANNLYFGTAIKILNEVIRELKIEQEVQDCLDRYAPQTLLAETIPELVRIEKEKCQCQKEFI